MVTAKLFMNGQSQAVRLPKDYRFSGNEVTISRLGDLVLLCQKGKEDALFLSSLGGFTDDFYDSVLTAREDDVPEVQRESL